MTVNSKYKFPGDPILVKLLRAAKSTPNKGAVIHDAYGYEKSYAQLLGDVLRMRDLIRSSLPTSALSECGILSEDAAYICVLALSSYEFLVAFFAIRALGGACVPLTSGVAPAEASYFLSTSKSICLLVGSHCIEKASQIKTYVTKNDSRELATVPIHCDGEPMPCSSFEIDTSINLAADGPGLLVFTSGTTGLPKGAVIPRRCYAFDRMIEPGNATACNRPASWMGGLHCVIQPIICGAELHTTKERAGADVIWELFRRSRITYMVFSPPLLRAMKEYYTDHICELIEGERMEYVNGFKRLSKISCAGAMIEPTVLRFWSELTRIPFRNIYAATEAGRMIHSLDSKLTSSIGHPLHDVQVKLSHGDHGEIRIKSPWMITRYLDREEATRAAFDEDGFYKTGDLGEVKDGEYVFTGRANIDFIYFNGYQVSALRLEDSLTSLPYIAEAHVLGVPDHDFKEKTAAVVRLKSKIIPSGELSLAKLRSDLAESLPTYMLPSHLRILRDGEDVPRTNSMKPMKKKMLTDYFVREHFWDAENGMPGVESFGDPNPQQAEARPWDWVGLQRAG